MKEECLLHEKSINERLEQVNKRICDAVDASVGMYNKVFDEAKKHTTSSPETIKSINGMREDLNTVKSDVKQLAGRFEEHEKNIMIALTELKGELKSGKVETEAERLKLRHEIMEESYKSFASKETETNQKRVAWAVVMAFITAVLGLIIKIK